MEQCICRKCRWCECEAGEGGGLCLCAFIPTPKPTGSVDGIECPIDGSIFAHDTCEKFMERK